jgi:hypothetical protein
VVSSTHHGREAVSNTRHPHPSKAETLTIPVAISESTLASAPSSDPAMDVSIMSPMLIELVTADKFSRNSYQFISHLLVGDDTAWKEYFSSLNAQEFSCIIANVRPCQTVSGIIKKLISHLCFTIFSLLWSNSRCRRIVSDPASPSWWPNMSKSFLAVTWPRPFRPQHLDCPWPIGFTITVPMPTSIWI